MIQVVGLILDSVKIQHLKKIDDLVCDDPLQVFSCIADRLLFSRVFFNNLVSVYIMESYIES